MTGDNEAPQIAVNADPMWDQLQAGVRQVVPIVIAFAMGRHWIEGDTATLLGAVIGFGVIIAGQLHTRHRAKQLASIASDSRTPDAVAIIKP